MSSLTVHSKVGSLPETPRIASTGEEEEEGLS